MDPKEQIAIRCTAEQGWDGLAAALAAATPGRTLVIEPGRYRGTQTLMVPAGVTLRGNPGAVLEWRGSGSALLVDAADDVWIVGLVISGGATGIEGWEKQGLSDQALIHARGCRGLRIEDCSCSGGGVQFHGIHLQQSSDCVVERCRASGCRVGLKASASSEVSVRDGEWFENGHGIVVGNRPDDADARSDVELTGNRCHDNDQSGIVFFSSQGRAEGNECWGNGSDGIVLARDPKTPDAPSDAELTANRCHDNGGAGILFFSSQGRADGNECWGNAYDGIALKRGSKTPDAPSDAELTANRCHDNGGAGIRFTSSHGRADRNECWGNAYDGIVLRRDPNTPDAPSDAELTANRCHDNGQAGILFFSSQGRADGNECWGNAVGGIVLQRNPDTLDAPSDAEVTANRCHDNGLVGIGFSSSHGRAEGNECWGNAYDGIVLQRDPKTPDAPSDAELTANRCHNNGQAGIEFASSHGRVEGNECWGNALHGIMLKRNPDTPDAPSDAEVTSNRCHDNSKSGIVFISSHGRADRNECWGNGSSGIDLQRDSGSLDAPSDAELTANRCHDNGWAGILFFSSHGRADGNECWGNAVGGIVLQQDPDTLDAPSDAELTANRCHDNGQAGILFTSSQGRADGNECWGNAYDGIALNRNPATPDAPSDAELTANLCHDNGQSGIRFASSQGRADRNECWGNRVSDTIAVEAQRLDVEQVGLGARILPLSKIDLDSHSTTPSLSEDQLRAARLALRPDAVLVQALQQQAIDDAEGLADFLSSGCDVCFMRYWGGHAVRARGEDAITVPEAGPLPDAVHVYRPRSGMGSGGCAGVGSVVGSGSGSGPGGRPDSARGGFEIVRVAADGGELPSLEERAAQRARGESGAAPEDSESPPLPLLFERFVQAWLTQDEARDGEARGGPAWTLALVSATATGLDPFVERLRDHGGAWLASLARQQAEAHTEGLRIPGFAEPWVLDLGGLQAGPADEADGNAAAPAGNTAAPAGNAAASSTEAAAAAGQERLWSRFADHLLAGRRPSAERLRELAGLPLAGLLGLGLLALLLVAGLLLGSVWSGGVAPALLQDLAASDPGAWPTGLGRLAAGLWHGWTGLPLLWDRVVWVAWLVAALWVWVRALNLLLPQRLHAAIPVFDAFLVFLLNHMLGAIVSAGGPLLRTGPWRWAVEHRRRWDARLEDAARRRWLHHRLFGHWWRGPDLCVVILQGLEWLPPGSGRWLRALFEGKGRRQGLLLITQTAGLSNLVNAYVDVWFGNGRPLDGKPVAALGAGRNGAGDDRPRVPFLRALIIHDPASAHITALPTPTAATPALAWASAWGAAPTSTPVSASAWTQPWGAAPGSTVVPGIAPSLASDIEPAALSAPADDDEAHDLAARELAEILGLPERGSNSGGDGSLAFDDSMGALLSSHYSPTDLLPALVLGSAPTGQMALVKRSGEEYADYKDSWGPEVAPYIALLDDTGDRSRPSHEALRRCFERGTHAQGILPWRSELGHGVAWYGLSGRPGFRLRLVAALRRWCADTRGSAGRAAAVAIGESAGGPATGIEQRLARFVGCGELYQLRCLLDAVAGRARPGHPAPVGERLPLQMEAALFLLRDRLLLTPAKGVTPPVLAEAWRDLEPALDRPSCTPLPRDGARIYCVWLAAVEAMDGAGVGDRAGVMVGAKVGTGAGAVDDGAERGRKRRLPGLLDRFIAVLDGRPDEAVAAGSIRALFYAEARRLTDLLGVVEAADAQRILDQRLRQDWALLPKPWRVALRERCIDRAGVQLLADLAAADDDERLLAITAGFAARPSLVVAALAWLALAYHRAGRDDGGQADAGRIAVGRFIEQLRVRLAPGSGDRAAMKLPRLSAPPGFLPEHGALAATLVADAGFARRLGDILVRGLEARRRMERLVSAMGRVELDGVALGNHSPATAVIRSLERETREIRLLGGSA